MRAVFALAVGSHATSLTEIAPVLSNCNGTPHTHSRSLACSLSRLRARARALSLSLSLSLFYTHTTHTHTAILGSQSARSVCGRQRTLPARAQARRQLLHRLRMCRVRHDVHMLERKVAALAPANHTRLSENDWTSWHQTRRQVACVLTRCGRRARP